MCYVIFLTFFKLKQLVTTFDAISAFGIGIKNFYYRHNAVMGALALFSQMPFLHLDTLCFVASGLHSVSPLVKVFIFNPPGWTRPSIVSLFSRVHGGSTAIPLTLTN